MRDIESLVTELAANRTIILEENEYQIKNCVIASHDDMLRACLFIKLESGDLVQISIKTIE